MMNRSLLWRGLLILAILALALWFALPLDKKINLGLDLQGGMHLVLQVKTEDALRAETESDMQLLANEAKDEGLTLAPRRISDSSFEVSGIAPEAKSRVTEIANREIPDWDVADQPERLVLTRTAQATKTIRDLAVAQAVQTIRNRVDQFGVAEPVIQEADNYRILVQLPGVDDPERVRRLIKNTAFLEFRITAYPEAGGEGVSREDIMSHYGGQLPPDVEILSRDIRNERGAVTGQSFFAVQKARAVTGRDLKTAKPSRGQFNDPIVQFVMTPTGSKAFGDLTGANQGRGLAIVLDGKVVTAPVIRAKITDSGVIEGSFTQEEVQDLSTVLRSGALPAGITYLEERTVGPSLGRDSIQQGLMAGMVGTGLVVLTMIAIYALSGVNAVVALVLNIVMLFGALGMFHSTLTLPGIAGIILTIGMAVDANVLVFERIREELRAGKSVRASIDAGFERALSSIIDSNVTTLVAALFLFQFGTGPIRGFAVTLSVGLLASMFTAVFVSRWLFDLVLSQRRVQKLSI
jgi:preprotein translocase subunit SecD